MNLSTADGRPAVMRLLFPRGVRIAHFILIPALGMGLTLGLFRLVDRLVLPGTSPGGHDAYAALRAMAIAVMMSSLIGFLAIQSRSAYEAKLQARNEDLEATRDFLARIIGGSAEAIITRDTAGLVTSWNPAAEAIYGWSAAEMLGQPIDRLVPDDPETRADLERAEAALAQGQTVRSLEVRRLRKEGKPISVALTMSPIYDGSGLRVGSTGIVRDVTSLKEMEALLVERERLAAIGEVAAMVAHEVRNPLAGIRGGCEILMEGYAESDARSEIGREIIHQVDRLNRTVQELLLFTRPKAIDPVPTDLHGLLNRLLSILREDPAHAPVAVRLEYDREPPVALADGRQIEQVFFNLLLNAYQAVGGTGQVTVSTSRDVRTVAVAIGDTGPGIPPERVDQIFKPFFTTRAQGTGLGLAICKRIVESHGGRIEVSSPPEGGARFRVVLPRSA